MEVVVKKEEWPSGDATELLYVQQNHVMVATDASRLGALHAPISWPTKTRPTSKDT